MSNYLEFESFASRCAASPFAYVRPYGIYYRGEVYWDKKLPRKPGTVIRYFEDVTADCPTLIVLDMDGNYLCNAHPVSWHENDHPSQHEMRAWMASLSPEERAELMKDE